MNTIVDQIQTLFKYMNITYCVLTVTMDSNLSPLPANFLGNFWLLQEAKFYTFGNALSTVL